jgi:metallo-beta-lactamase family protein
MRITFCGAAGAVTGSNYLLEANGKKFIIDCGLHQGGLYAEEENFEPFAYDPAEISAVFVTHAHIDHIGRIPKLVKEGFRGTIYSTPPTKDFAEELLLDSEHILAHEAERAGRDPLYTADDVIGTMKLWDRVHYGETFDVEGISVIFRNAGHILGSAIIEIKAEGKTIVFSGDLGNYPPSIIQTTEFLDHADYCVVDSTYGNRVHEDAKAREEQLKEAVIAAAKLGGVIMIPAFAMERTQDLLYYLNDLFTHHKIPRMPVYIDSPLAIKLTAVYKKYENYFDRKANALVRSGDDIFNFPGLHLCLSKEQSKEINHAPSPKIVIAGSGMSNGGRILHHEARYLSDPRSTILFVGYQAEGTLGRQIISGAKSVAIAGEEIEVRCQIKELTGYSAHADQPRILRWLEPMKGSLKKVFVTHGEPDAAGVLKEKVKEGLQVEAVAPKAGETFVL